MDSRKGLSAKASYYTSVKKKSCASNTNKFVPHPQGKENGFCTSLDNVLVNACPQTSLLLCPLMSPLSSSLQRVGGTPLLCFVSSVCEWQLVLVGCDRTVIWQALAEIPVQKANLFQAPNLQGLNEVLGEAAAIRDSLKMRTSSHSY